MQVDKHKDVNKVYEISGEKYRDMLLGALMWLKEQQAFIDSLNVFPVPDGDTGTNMYLTFLDAVKAVKKIETNDVSAISEALARGALMGARGNSGVILSQLIRGFQVANKKNKTFSTANLAESLRKASEIAYQGVLKPVEGTILTVSRKAAEGAEIALENNLDLVGMMESTIAYAQEALNKTPELLPALKDAGVVDAGGQGYLTILEGMLKGLVGEKDFKTSELELVKVSRTTAAAPELNYVYCTEILIDLKADKGINEIRSELESYGDSLLVVGTEDFVKVHIHTNHPGIILEYGLKLGSLSDIKIDNMQLQSAEKIEKQEAETRKEYMTKKKGIIAVGQGEGIKKIFEELGVDIVISGGQSMNPSINDFVTAINNINSMEIVILPNNKNIISAAEQAASLTDKKIAVIPTRSIPQAIASLMAYDEDTDLDELKEMMTDEIDNVKCIEITRAVKDSKVNGMEIKEGDVIAIYNQDIRTVGTDYNQVIIELIKEIHEDEELVTLLFGEDVCEEEALELKKELEDNFEFEEIEVYNGQQSLYPYIISLE
ncbi:MAG: DAK2 domain-containing protein [Halanaerobiaceae bacterium]|nr:DAK2 domain-containing protein [Halanaerobiaceae bacterium]